MRAGDNRIEDRSALPGARRAAILLLALGADATASIFEHLEADDVKVLSLAMARLGVVTNDDIDATLNNFGEAFSSHRALVGDVARTEEFLFKVLPRSQAELVVEELRSQADRNIWMKLSGVEPNLLTSYLKSEHPQTAALILSQLPSHISAVVLGSLPDDIAVDTLNRMLSLRSVDREALEDVEKALHAEFIAMNARAARRDPHEMIADVFNQFDSSAERRLFDALEATNAPAAGRIKELMFTFDDLLKLPPAGIQTLLQDFDRGVLAKSLRGAPEKVIGAFTSNMSTRGAKLLMDDIEGLGPIRLKDVEGAKAQLVMHAKDKINKGEIVAGKSRDDELV